MFSIFLTFTFTFLTVRYTNSKIIYYIELPANFYNFIDVKNYFRSLFGELTKKGRDPDPQHLSNQCIISAHWPILQHHPRADRRDPGGDQVPQVSQPFTQHNQRYQVSYSYFLYIVRGISAVPVTVNFLRLLSDRRCYYILNVQYTFVTVVRLTKINQRERTGVCANYSYSDIFW
jgi:hypothetical protein